MRAAVYGLRSVCGSKGAYLPFRADNPEEFCIAAKAGTSRAATVNQWHEK
nr:MAG TPA: hypothetical protein [Caudoviricetes sp.]